jgi:lysophospholipase L1-like esterase
VRSRRRRCVAAAVAGLVGAALLAAGAARAVTLVGSPKADVLKGTTHADKLYGRAGNDRLYGYGGNDLLIGGPGKDVLSCGPGHDVAIAEKGDTVNGCEIIKGLPKPLPPSPPSDEGGGLYVALGTSITAGLGASSATKTWVWLYFGYLSSNASGVTRLSNIAEPGVTSDEVRRLQLSRAVALIDQPSDTLRVTIDVGSNDILNVPSCDHPSDSACPVSGNIVMILKRLNEALARDLGDETIQIMEYYNWEFGTPRESANRVRLLGSDLKIDCSATGRALGLNDLIHCIALEQGAVPVDVLPAFDAGGVAFLDVDHLHPNDAGYLAIAKAFGGAVERAP